MRRSFHYVVLWLALSMAGPAGAQTRPSDAELAAALKVGGHVIVFRHGATFSNQADTDPLNTRNVRKQRQLNEAGKAAAKALGSAFKEIGVPAGQVLTSQFNRAY